MWASSTTQCLIPGFNSAQFPWTYSMDNVCDQRVITLDLIDVASPDMAHPTKVGLLYVFKDYADNMYVTVSLNATWSASHPQYDPTNHGFRGQYLHAQPGLSSGGSGAVGKLWLWDQVPFTLMSDVPVAYRNMLASDNPYASRWVWLVGWLGLLLVGQLRWLVGWFRWL